MSMTRHLLAAAACAALALPAQASIITYVASLSGAAEAPPNASTGTGRATIIFDDVLDTMRVQVMFSGLNGFVTAAHIHCCTLNPFTSTVGVATVTPTFTGFPGGAGGLGSVTAGTYDHLFDMTAAAGSWNPAFVTAHGNSRAQAFDDLLAGAATGRAYLNIHTTLVPTGEIRGFLVVPEPTALSLTALALAGLALMRQRRST